MSVSNVKQRNRLKAFYELFSFTDTPDRMSHAIRRSEVKQRRYCCRGGNLFIDLGPSPVSQKHWTSLRAQHQHVTCAIVFFIASRALMFTNRAVVVLVDGTNGCDSDLLVVPH